ncbi:MAG: exonuclease SbcCD subunit D, partial [Oscillospiraceae bacterium]|nr:exonuclease SbcCD subunit D [Oscillospiraceae bacterium]
MKFFHLSDLHIGKNVNGFSMIEEQKHVFAQIIGYIKTERPAAVIIAGDVYDRAIPSVEAVFIFDDFLTALARENMAVMLISGNHDSPERINFASRLLSDKLLFLCGTFDGSIQKKTLTDEYGDINFWLLPFIKPSSLRGMFLDSAIESYDEAIAAALKTANIDYAARNVLVSHQFYTKAGVTPIRSESELNPVGGLDAVDAGFIERFDYAALGHLHGIQSIGAEHIRYCGSPLKYSFSEWRQKKSVTVVELGAKGDLTVKSLPLCPLRDMREIKGELEKLLSNEVSGLANKEDYLRVILTDEEEIIDPMGKLRSVYPNIMSLGFENSRTRIDIE